MALSQREKALVVIPILLAGLLGFYRTVHGPLLSRRAAAQELSAKTRADLKIQQAKLAKEGDLSARLTAVASREETIDAWVPGKNSAALFIWYLSRAEARSGVRVQGLTVGERKEVKVEAKKAPSGSSSPPAQAVPPAPEPSDDSAQPASPTPAATHAPPAPAVDPAVTVLTVVELNLKLNGRFAEHLLFSQELEETPLFVSTEGLELSSAAASPVETANKFFENGTPWMAAQALQSSPALSGNYRILLYFKSAKVGPSTEPMQFAEPTGRPDPFVMDGVEEFLQTLLDYYSSVLGDGTSDPSGGNPWSTESGGTDSQMG